MEKNINQLIQLSIKFGKDPDYIIAGGGNSSFKTADKMWVKASGTSMATISEDGFVCLDREKMQVISQKQYSSDTSLREQEVKNDLHQAILFPEGKRPSVEASMHEIIDYAFIMHTHPTLVNGVLCANNSKEVIAELFGDEVVYVPYIDPGYILFKEVEKALLQYRKEKGSEPQLIFLENHGIFVGANTSEEIEQIYADVEQKLSAKVSSYQDVQLVYESEQLLSLVNPLDLGDELNRAHKIANVSELSKKYVASKEAFEAVNKPFTPDNIVYCKSKYLYVEDTDSIKQQAEQFKQQNGYNPKLIAIQGKGIVAFEESEKSAQIVLDVFKDMMKVSFLTDSFGGPRPMTQEQIDFIDNWEVENYRRKMSKASS